MKKKNANKFAWVAIAVFIGIIGVVLGMFVARPWLLLIVVGLVVEIVGVLRSRSARNES